MARLIDADALLAQWENYPAMIKDASPDELIAEMILSVTGHMFVGIKRSIKEAPTVNQWHRVEDELPSMDGYDWVLGVVTGEAGYHRFHKAIMMVSFDPEYKEWFIDEYPDAKITVSHWMLLPEAPKEKEDDTAGT